MTRKHFIMLATLIREHNAQFPLARFNILQVAALCEYCLSVNSHLDTDLFLATIGWENIPQ